jgi:hypothetical protein
MYVKLMPSAWTPECEELLAEWSEKASCFRWLHARCEKRYRARYHSFAIPVIILSTVTGFANVGLSEFVPEQSMPVAQAIIGGVNLLAGVLGTLQSFLKVAETMESHRSAGVAWSKLGRNISIELALDPARRALAQDFLAASRAEYDRLTEQSPAIDDAVIDLFRSRFKEYDVAKPAIANGLDKCTIFKRDPDAPLSPELGAEFHDGSDVDP